MKIRTRSAIKASTEEVDRPPLPPLLLLLLLSLLLAGLVTVDSNVVASADGTMELALESSPPDLGRILLKWRDAMCRPG